MNFDDNAHATFGAGSEDLVIHHDGTNSIIENHTNQLVLRSADGNSSNVKLQAKFGEDSIVAVPDAEVQLYHNNVQTLFTTGIGITVGISTIQTNGNAAFPGITTLGSPGGGSQVIVNNLLNVNSGANITGIATLAQAYIAKLAQSNGTSGSVNEVPVANGSGGWSWAPVNTAGASILQGITVQEEGSNVGTAGSIATLNFVGGDVTADATAQQGICTVTIDSSIQGITTSGTSFLHDITQTGVTTITSDQEAAY